MPETLSTPLALGMIMPFMGFFIIAILWSIAWKGYALWLAARNGHTWWFVALLLINTLAILEIIYIFAISRPEMKKRENAPPSASAN